MLTFNSKFITILAIALMIYFAYTQYQERSLMNPATRADFQEVVDKKQAAHAMYKINMPRNKKYEDYNPLEKFLYKFYGESEEE